MSSGRYAPLSSQSLTQGQSQALDDSGRGSSPSLLPLPLPQGHLPTTGPAKPKGNLPKRTTKTAQKLKLFPEGIVENLVPEALPGDEPLLLRPGRPVPLNTVTQQEHPKDAAYLNRLERKWLPRVTGFCTANAYKLDALYEALKAQGSCNGTLPRRFDEGTLLLLIGIAFDALCFFSIRILLLLLLLLHAFAFEILLSASTRRLTQQNSHLHAVCVFSSSCRGSSRNWDRFFLSGSSTRPSLKGSRRVLVPGRQSILFTKY
jgi:hypothetical protein